MEHTNTDQSEISRDVSRPTSKTIAMGLPEILHNIFLFLDQTTLEDCLHVSRLWYTHGKSLVWRTFYINLFLFLSLACDVHVLEASNKAINNAGKDKKNGNDQKGRVKDKSNLQGFVERCRHIRSLTLISPKTQKWINPVQDTLDPRVVGLKNLDHFGAALQYCILGPKIYQLAGAILSQNPGIQEIDWRQGYGFSDQDLMNLMLKRVVGGKLKKLTISAYFRESKMQFLEYLIEANEKRQGRQAQQVQKQQEGGAISIQGPLTDQSVGNENNSLQGHEGHGFELNELVLRNWLGYPCRGKRSKLNLEWLYSYSGALPIRALSFINFETWTRHPLVPDDEEQGDDEVEADEPGSSILPILSKCPDLEKLCVSFDLRPVLPDNSSRRFINSLTEESHYYNSETSGYEVGEEDEDFVEYLYEYCPKLREIEFGMFYQLTSDHWIEMMGLYGHQLESLSIWGNVPAFNSKAFMTFLGRPVSAHTVDRLNPLTRLNINGMEHLHECAWMALYTLPHLKEFRARDVPLDAESLIDGNWICRGLEVLEICVAIPKRTRWQWSDTDGIWMKVHKHYGRDMKDERKDESMGEDTDEEEEIQDDTAEALKRRLMYLGAERPMKKARVDWMECIDTQVKVCKALGRLTQLRELRIEGRRHFVFGKRDWGCLALTLEKGLEYLAPLRQNLERLLVPRLDEGLGRKEVEWIARNWIHHSNSHWLEQHHASQSMEGPERSMAAGVQSDGDVSFDPRSKFKALIGISGEGEDAMSNIKWLREQCPTLSVIEVE